MPFVHLSVEAVCVTTGAGASPLSQGRPDVPPRRTPSTAVPSPLSPKPRCLVTCTCLRRTVLGVWPRIVLGPAPPEGVLVAASSQPAPAAEGSRRRESPLPRGLACLVLELHVQCHRCYVWRSPPSSLLCSIGVTLPEFTRPF